MLYSTSASSIVSWLVCKNYIVKESNRYYDEIYLAILFLYWIPNVFCYISRCSAHPDPNVKKRGWYMCKKYSPCKLMSCTMRWRRQTLRIWGKGENFIESIWCLSNGPVKHQTLPANKEYSQEKLQKFLHHIRVKWNSKRIICWNFEVDQI